MTQNDVTGSVFLDLGLSRVGSVGTCFGGECF